MDTDAGEPKRLLLLDDLESHPISVDEAAIICDPLIGTISARTWHRWRLAWWDGLRAATTPAQKLSCERMLNRISFSMGLSEHERGAEVARLNRAGMTAAGIDRADAAALDRWR